MIHAVLAAIALGAIMTVGDFLWEALQIRHRVLFGLIHGAAVCLFIGLAIGLRERRAVPGILGGLLIGVIAAAAFYLLAPWLRFGAMFPAWMLFWLLFALLQAWLRPPFGPHEAVARGLAAALLSGLAFYAISGIWTEHGPGGPNYLRNFLSWSFAFFPGFAMLFVAREARR